MLIIIDHRIPEKAKEMLSKYGELLEIKTDGITYPAVSCHPDIFFCQSPDRLIVAPNLPERYLQKLKNNDILFIPGELTVGKEYPETSRYNAVASNNYLIHNFRHTDFVITRTFEDHTPIHVDQGYCRCNLLPLKDDHFITSDEGIYKVLKRHTENIIKVTTDGILLEGFPNGFFGGCCGVIGDNVFINGSLKFHQDGKRVGAFLQESGYEIIELYDGPLFDGGGIICLED